MPAALLASIALGAAQVTSQPLIVALLTVGTLGGGLWLARVCRTDSRLLLLIVGVIVVHLVLLAERGLDPAEVLRVLRDRHRPGQRQAGATRTIR